MKPKKQFDELFWHKVGRVMGQRIGFEVDMDIFEEIVIDTRGLGANHVKELLNNTMNGDL